MGKVNERNQKISSYLNSLITKAKDATYIVDESSYKTSLDTLFTTDAWGFREIILVVVVGRKMDESYKASKGLYDCNPRAIYEGPIKDFFIENNIPHRKSGPLNIAKATKGLDTAWAAQRKPQKVAQKVVDIVNLLEKSQISDFVDMIGVSLLRRLIAESSRVEKLKVNVKPSADPEWLYKISHELITKAPDAGNTPQKIAAFLLKNYHSAMNTGIIVTGEEDRASVTSTTSKKPGDVNEESADGKIYKVYEITVKPFDIARIRDSYDCVNAYNQISKADLHEIIVICRPEDCLVEMKKSSTHSYMGSYEYQDIIYYYWNIYEWVCGTLQRMPFAARSSFYSDLNNYISDINTSETVKKLWLELHSKKECADDKN